MSTQSAVGLGVPRKIDNADAEQVVRHVEMFYFAAAVAKGDFIVSDLAETTYGLGAAAKESTTTADEPCLGVAAQAVAAGEWGPVVTYGVATTASLGGSVAAGDALATGTTAGQAVTAANTDVNVVGYALEDDTANVGAVFVQCR